MTTMMIMMTKVSRPIDKDIADKITAVLTPVRELTRGDPADGQ